MTLFCKIWLHVENGAIPAWTQGPEKVYMALVTTCYTERCDLVWDRVLVSRVGSGAVNAGACLDDGMGAWQKREKSICLDQGLYCLQMIPTPTRQHNKSMFGREQSPFISQVQPPCLSAVKTWHVVRSWCATRWTRVHSCVNVHM